ncbi:MAG: hypothetical protein ACI32Q_04060 [Intestinibaculum porci]|uniref:hypothetical protein n=1 Tax=Intestinibaculum porci TaxID=2487118 RepID=UPI003F0C9243
MLEIVGVELYKMRKKKQMLVIILYNLISFLYGAGIRFRWKWVSFNGKFDLVQYIGAIWQLLFLIGIPLIFFMYIGASIVGGERREGQMFLEITRVANRKKLISAKIISVVIIISLYAMANVLCSIVTYSVFLKNTHYATSRCIILNHSNIDLIITCLFGYIDLVIFVLITMLISINNTPVSATIVGTVIYAILLFLVKINQIAIYIPGCFALSSRMNITNSAFVLQLIICLLSLFLLIKENINQFYNLDL